MKNLFSKIGLGLMSLMVVVFGASNVPAAVDAGFASSSNSLGAVFTDNSDNIWAWVGLSLGIALLLALGIRALLFGKRQIIGAVPGGKKRR